MEPFDASSRSATGDPPYSYKHRSRGTGCLLSSSRRGSCPGPATAGPGRQRECGRSRKCVRPLRAGHKLCLIRNGAAACANTNART
jgi:hypothetical protein